MSNKSKICAPGEKMLIDGVWYQRVGVLDFSLVECDPPKPETPAVEECAGCRYWKNHGYIGDCRRVPPVQGGDVTVALFPRTNRDSWCGEWRAK